MFPDRFGLGSNKDFRLAGPLDFGCTDTRPTPRLIILKMGAIAWELFGFRVIGFVSYRNKDMRLKCYRIESREVV